ncbi:unnamed protein product, partial [Prorocentrum cordatum]
AREPPVAQLGSVIDIRLGHQNAPAATGSGKSAAAAPGPWPSSPPRQEAAWPPRGPPLPGQVRAQAARDGGRGLVEDQPLSVNRVVGPARRPAAAAGPQQAKQERSGLTPSPWSTG